jgi:mRNA interferase RelE/StbE
MLKSKVRAALTNIINPPDCGKALKLELTGLWTYRVGRFRIIYRLGADKIVELVAVGPRKTIYEETYRLLAKVKK